MMPVAAEVPVFSIVAVNVIGCPTIPELGADNIEIPKVPVPPCVTQLFVARFHVLLVLHSTHLFEDVHEYVADLSISVSVSTDAVHPP